MLQLRSSVIAAKERLAEGFRQWRERHESGMPAVEVCAGLTAIRDEALVALYQAALVDLAAGPLDDVAERVTLVAHGGYGRCDVAPCSDVDLMILHDYPSDEPLAPLAQRLVRDVFDAGLVLGHSVCTVNQACATAMEDCLVCTTLAESRLLLGPQELYDRFWTLFRRRVSRRAAALVAAIEKARGDERLRYGETVFLLEPNLKRSRGALRDIQLLRWIGFVRYGERTPRQLQAVGRLSDSDGDALAQANEFLLRLRNDLHFRTGKPGDVLDRSEQLRLAERYNYPTRPGLLPVEQFMRDYFRHTNRVSHVVSQFVARARSKTAVVQFVAAMLGHRVEDYRVGPAGIKATRRAVQRLRGNLSEIMRLVDLANHYDVPIAPEVWDLVRQDAAQLPETPDRESCVQFLSFLGCSSRLGDLLHDLHETGILERFIPAFAHARGLLQFNQYHKYTVDEHCLRAVEAATELSLDNGPLGHAYRALKQKRLLHLALLIHDLGKGFPENHLVIGERIAAEVAQRLGLPALEAESLGFLVAEHQMMGQIAFRRDTTDPQLVLRFALDVGSPELLKSLYVLTACDYGAVGPGVWDSWKADILTDLYGRAMEHLTGDSADVTFDDQLQQRRAEAAQLLRQRAIEPWFARHMAALPQSYLTSTAPELIAQDLLRLAELAPNDVAAQGAYQADTDTLLFTIATHEHVAPGIFHRLTGALTSEGLEIRTAQINTLSDGLVIDRFEVFDPDYAGASPPQRLAEVERALVHSLRAEMSQPPTFRRRWQPGRRETGLPRAEPRVNVDNTSSDAYTVFDVFAHDRPGLLYSIARKFFELGLSVSRARIATHVDQALDVFYVADQASQKIRDEARLAEIRRQLREACAAEGAT